MRITIANFQGMRPAVSEKLLDNSMATLAQDVDLLKGTITPLSRNDTEIATLGKFGTVRSLYRMNTGTWLHWTEDVDVAPIPIANNEYERLMFTGTDQPRMTDATKAIAGGGDSWPEVSYFAGIPVPDQLITTDAPSEADENKLARVYTYTYVTAWNEEGPPAAPSSIFYVNDGDSVTLSNFAGNPSGAYQIVNIRIYRALVGNSGDGSYLLIKELPVTTTTWVDTVKDINAGSSLVTTTWSPPDANMLGVVPMANGMLAGYFDNMLCFSEPYQGHAWPEDYRKPMEQEITGISAAGNMLYVATKGNPYVVIGNHPTVMGENKLETTQTMVSARSLVDIGDGAIYAGSDGLVLLTGEGASLATKDIIHEDYWQALVPESIHAYFYKGRYVGFYDNGGTQAGFIYDIEKKTFSLISAYCTAAFSEQSEGELYIVKSDNKVYQFDEGAVFTGVWESKYFETPPTNFATAKVDADNYPVTFKLYADNVLTHTETVANDDSFRLPAGYYARTWRIRIETTYEIHGVFMANAVSEL